MSSQTNCDTAEGLIQALCLCVLLGEGDEQAERPVKTCVQVRAAALSGHKTRRGHNRVLLAAYKTARWNVKRRRLLAADG